jgi:hypothetical protein
LELADLAIQVDDPEDVIAEQILVPLFLERLESRLMYPCDVVKSVCNLSKLKVLVCKQEGIRPIDRGPIVKDLVGIVGLENEDHVLAREVVDKEVGEDGDYVT